MTWYAIEGMDGSGKSSVANIIVKNLEAKNRKVLVITHPNTDNRWGSLASKYLHGKNSTLNKLKATVFYIFDVLKSLRYKRKHRKEYDDFIFVRYSMAAAYLPKSLIRLGYRVIEIVLPIPDVKIFVDIDPKIALERINSRGDSLEIFETIEELNKTREKMFMISESWTIIDNGRTMEDTERSVEWVLSEFDKKKN